MISTSCSFNYINAFEKEPKTINSALVEYHGICLKREPVRRVEAEDAPMNKAGNRYLRYYMIEASSSMIQYCPEYKAFYDKKFAEVRPHQHERAFALTSHKLIHMLLGLLTNSKLY